MRIVKGAFNGPVNAPAYPAHNSAADSESFILFFQSKNGVCFISSLLFVEDCVKLSGICLRKETNPVLSQTSGKAMLKIQCLHFLFYLRTRSSD